MWIAGVSSMSGRADVKRERIGGRGALLALQGIIFYDGTGAILKKAARAGFDCALSCRREYIVQKRLGHRIGGCPQHKDDRAPKGIGAIEDGLIRRLDAIDKEEGHAIPVFVGLKGRTHGDI